MGLRNRKRTVELMSMLELGENFVTSMRQWKLRWCEHVTRRDVTVGIG